MIFFFKYFSELGNDIFQTTDEESEYFSNTHDFNDIDNGDNLIN
jgi:hypothetical protein